MVSMSPRPQSILKIQLSSDELAAEKKRLEIRFVNMVKGKGVFAKVPIAKDQPVITYPGYVYRDEDLGNRNEKRFKYAWQYFRVVGQPGNERVETGYTINAGDASGGELPEFQQTYGPYENEPNAANKEKANLRPVMNYRRNPPALQYWSTADIRAGEELLVCYNRIETQHINGVNQRVKRCDGVPLLYLSGNRTRPGSFPTPGYITTPKTRRPIRASGV